MKKALWSVLITMIISTKTKNTLTTLIYQTSKQLIGKLYSKGIKMDFITQWVTIFQPAMNQAIVTEQAAINACRGGAFLILLTVGALVIALITAYNAYHNKQRKQ